jgi:hypothetical protein
MYTKPHVRQGLLGRMLRELLQTRVMVKQAMKGVKNDKVMFPYACFGIALTDVRVKARRRVLDARQLGLKFISNVTYGYTSATFSGRMPAVEIADSIVQSGRETLEKVNLSQGAMYTSQTDNTLIRPSSSYIPHQNGAQRWCMAIRTHCSYILLERPRSKPFGSDTT